MTDSRNTDPRKTDDALIIAYLTGQASAAEAIQFKSRIGVDVEFRDHVERLEHWLAPLGEDVDEIAPPDGLLNSIMNQLDGDDLPLRLDRPANDRAEAERNATVWRRFAIAASAIAVLSLAAHGVQLSGRSGLSKVAEAPSASETDTWAEANEAQRYMALLSGETPSPLVAIIYNPTTGEVVARMSNVDIPSDGDLQLWLIRDGASAPLSLGLLDRINDGQSVLSIPASLNAQTDILALSLEVKGGSPSAGPEGPVLYTGAVSALN